MAENLINRVGRIISGGFHSIVSALEDAAPEPVLEKAIGEIDEAVDEVRRELGRIMAKKHLAANGLARENQRHEELSEKIEIALAEGREDLAEVAVAAQLDIEAQMPILEATVADCGTKEKELEGYVEALLAKKRQMNDELRSYRESRRDLATGGGSTTGGGGAGVPVETRVARAESAFERVLERATGVGGSSASASRDTAVRMAQLEELARKNRVRERLAAVKSKMGKD